MRSSGRLPRVGSSAVVILAALFALTAAAGSGTGKDETLPRPDVLMDEVLARIGDVPSGSLADFSAWGSVSAEYVLERFGADPVKDLVREAFDGRRFRRDAERRVEKLGRTLRWSGLVLEDGSYWTNWPRGRQLPGEWQRDGRRPLKPLAYRWPTYWAAELRGLRDAFRKHPGKIRYRAETVGKRRYAVVAFRAQDGVNYEFWLDLADRLPWKWVEERNGERTESLTEDWRLLEWRKVRVPWHLRWTTTRKGKVPFGEDEQFLKIEQGGDWPPGFFAVPGKE